MKSGVRQLGLALQAAGAEDGRVVGAPGREVQQGRLPHARIPGDRQRSPATGPCLREQPLDRGLLRLPAVQHLDPFADAELPSLAIRVGRGICHPTWYLPGPGRLTDPRAVLPA
jgi:hypothetical protein